MAHGMEEHGGEEIHAKDTKGGEDLNLEMKPLNERILHSLEETFNQSVQAVKDAVIGAEVNDVGDRKDESGQEQQEQEQEILEGKSLLRSVEDTIVQSVHSVEETIAQSVQTVKEAVNAAAEAAASPASSEDPRGKKDVTVEDEAAILVHSVVQD